jgi:acyl carrier protein
MDFKQTINDHLDEMGFNKIEDYDMDQPFKNLGIDSLDQVELIMKCEKEFNIEIPDNKAADIVTPRLLIEYLEKNVKEEE